MAAPETPPARSRGTRGDRPLPNVPRGLVFAAAIGWRVLVVAAVIVAFVWAIAQLRVAWLGILLAIFATAILRPPAQIMVRRGTPPALASLTVILSAIAVTTGLVWLLAPAVIDQVDELAESFSAGADAVRQWLVTGPLELSEADIEDRLDEAVQWVQDNTDAIASGVLTGAQLAVEIIAAFLLSIVLTFFLIKDGDRMWAWFVGLFSAAHQRDVAEVGDRSWHALSSYLRGMTVVATFDAVFIGIALVILGVPAALPLALLTFAGAYIPIAGAFVTGLLAVLVALVAEGLVTALLVLAAVIAVQQIESNLLHPIVVGRAVAVHPVAILLAVTVGALVGGIPGAFVAVPLTAMLTRAGEYMRERSTSTSVLAATATADGPREDVRA